VKEITRLKSLGVVGVEIGSHINDWNLENENLYPVYEALEAQGMCLFVHPWDMMGQSKMTKYWLPWLVGMPAETSLAICSMIFGGIFERYPKLRVAFAHGGGSFPMTIGRIEHGFHCRPDLVAIDNKVNPRNYLGKFWLDSLVHDKDALKFIVKLMGNNRVAMGSDYPFPLGETVPGNLIETSDFSPEVKAQLLYKNALEWLGLSEQRFKE
jgi:aminocarboxymuconate-semialdehyde decarboxylase